jgi:hypothetical protein
MYPLDVSLLVTFNIKLPLSKNVFYCLRWSHFQPNDARKGKRFRSPDLTKTNRVFNFLQGMFVLILIYMY